MFKSMHKNLCWLGMALCLSSVAVMADPAQETKKLEALPFALSVANEDQGKFEFQENAIVITAQKGTDLYTDTKGKTHADNTPRVLFEPKGDFIFSAKVSTAFDKAYDGGALVVYVDEHHWGKLLFERFQSGKNGIATNVTTGAGDGAYHTTHAASQQYLKIARRDDFYVFYASEDGKNWNFLRHFSLETDAPIKVGFSAQSPISDSLAVTFSDVKFRAEAFKDYWQGE